MPQPTLLFVDTEFTSLGEAGAPDLISIGACSLDGREFYLEADEFDPSLVSPFTRSYVLPLLERGSKAAPFSEIPLAFRSFVQGFDTGCIIVCDSFWDWAWIQLLAAGEQRMRPFGDNPSAHPFWPASLCPRRLHLDWDSLSEPAWTLSQASLELSFSTRHPHHALVDARANRDAFLEACSALKLDPLLFSPICGAFGNDEALSFFVESWMSTLSDRAC